MTSTQLDLMATTGAFGMITVQLRLRSVANGSLVRWLAVPSKREQDNFNLISMAPRLRTTSMSATLPRCIIFRQVFSITSKDTLIWDKRIFNTDTTKP